MTDHSVHRNAVPKDLLAGREAMCLAVLQTVKMKRLRVLEGPVELIRVRGAS